jgi:hypothetical protein
MQIRERLCRIVREADAGLIATDAVGRIHRLDSNLRVLQSSPVSRSTVPFYAVLAVGRWIVGRDKLGNIARWDARTLEMTHWIETESTANRSTLWEGEEPSLTISRGIAELDGKVYLNNGFMQLVVLDLETFAVEQVRESPTGDTPIEWISTECPGVQAVTDKEGNLRIGSLAIGHFPINLSLDDDANLHRVRYDSRHDRFWVIQDEGSGETAMISNGVVTVTREGIVDQEFRFALDDVECLEISADGTTVYAAGFDGVIEEFDNTEYVLRHSRTIGPFSHQVSDIALGESGSIYVLCQDGSLTHVARDGEKIAALEFERQCLWDVAVNEHGSPTLNFATDTGVVTMEVAVTSFGPPTTRVQSHLETGLGFSRRISLLGDGGVVISRSGCAARYVGEQLQWTSHLETLAHDLAVSPDGSRLTVATNAGAMELDASDGSELGLYRVDEAPVWACAYLANDELLLLSRAGVGVVLTSGRTERMRLEIGDYPKRVWQSGDGSVTVTGAGGIRVFDVENGRLLRHYREALSNTAENAVFHRGYCYVVTYDSQLGVFTDDGELLGVIEGVLPDFPKAMTIVGSDETGDFFLLVGGRGGYLQSFALGKDGSAIPAGTTWIPGALAPSPARYSVTEHRG